MVPCEIGRNLELGIGNQVSARGNQNGGVGIVNLSQIGLIFLPRARNLNAKHSMSYEFMYWLIFAQIHLT